MKYKKTKDLVNGDILARDVQRNSVLIIRAGTVIDAKMKRRLLKLGIAEVTVKTDKNEGSAKPSLSSSSRKEDLKKLFDADMKRLAVKERYGLALDDEAKVKVLENLFVSAMSISVIYEKMVQLREWDSESYDHVFDVFLLGSVLGEKLEIDDLTSFSLGCLLHDIGKLNIPKEILQKQGKLTAEEFEQIKHHTTCGYDMVRKMGLPEWMAVLAQSHHERLDGSGYPEGLPGSAVDVRTRMLMIVDVYSALTWKRAYRKPMPANQALATMFQERARFDDDILKTFACILHVFPVGADVILSNGEKATVTYVNPKYPSLPRLRPFRSTHAIQIPFNLKLRVERFIDWDANNVGMTKLEIEWNRYLHALTVGEKQEAVEAFSFLEAGKTPDDIYPEIFEKSIKEIEALYNRGVVTAIELQLAITSTRELLYTTLERYEKKEKNKGRISLTTVDGENRLLALQISAAALKTNGWKVYHLEKPLPAGELVQFLSRRNIGIVGFSVTSRNLTHQLIEAISFLKKELPKIIVVVGGSGVTDEAKKWADLYAVDSKSLIAKIEKYRDA